MTTTPEQLLTGLEIGLANLRVHCTCCDRALDEGEDVTFYAYRLADAPEWSIARCYCRDCAPGRFSTPTLGVSEVLAEATLATVSFVHEQRHSLCLTEVETVAVSPRRREMNRKGTIKPNQVQDFMAPQEEATAALHEMLTVGINWDFLFRRRTW